MTKKTMDHYEVTPAVIRKCEKLASRGLTIIQIGVSLGWSEETIHKKKREHPELAESIRKGQVRGVETVSNSLFKNANGFSYKEVHEESDTDEKGKITKYKKVIKKRVLPNTAAQIFYLKNRDPEHWKDKHDHDISGSIEINFDSEDEGL